MSAARRHVAALAGAALLGLPGPAPAATSAQAALHHPGDDVVLTLQATGEQLYDCRADAGGALAWSFVAPRAELFRDGASAGRHFAGPTWQLADGSGVVGRVEAKADGDTAQDIPWLRLAVASHAGKGALDPVGTVLRTETKGGMLQGACPAAGATRAVPYTADYLFIRQP